MKRGAQEDDRMKHPPSGEVDWISARKDNTSLKKIVKAKTWFDARALAARAHGVTELNDIIVELK